jgi:hypothetical protein
MGEEVDTRNDLLLTLIEKIDALLTKFDSFTFDQTTGALLTKI